MKVSIREDREIPLPELLRLYDSVGWVNYTARPERLERAFRGSLTVLGAWAEAEDGSETLAGVARAVGDGCTILFLQDLLVRPEYQRQGVGTALVRALLARWEGVYQIELAADREDRTVQFYRSLGFAEFSKLGCTGFMKLNPRKKTDGACPSVFCVSGI